MAHPERLELPTTWLQIIPDHARDGFRRGLVHLLPNLVSFIDRNGLDSAHGQQRNTPSETEWLLSGDVHICLASNSLTRSYPPAPGAN